MLSTNGQKSSPSAGLQPLGQPVGQVVAQLVGQRRAIDGLHLREPVLLGLGQRRAQEAFVALPAEDGQAPLHLALAGLREVLEQQALAQHGVGGLGQRVALAAAERAVLAEEVRHDVVGRLLELQHAVQQFGGEFEQGVGVHQSRRQRCGSPRRWRTVRPSTRSRSSTSQRTTRG